VVVLDFDLSWHLDAFDVSVTQPGAANGYLAPEQVNRESGVSTRNAAVDSFGLGMTFYFMLAMRDPVYAQHLHASWQETLQDLAASRKCATWQSIPLRFARMIHRATRDAQSERWDVAHIESEIERLSEAEREPAGVVSVELLAEEIAHRAFDGHYFWNEQKFEAKYSLGSIDCTVAADVRQRLVRVTFGWQRLGSEHHKKIREWLPDRQQRIRSLLSSFGWQCSVSLDTGRLFGSATIESDVLRARLDGCVKVLRESIRLLDFN
jgi:hypothetical protein